MMVILQKKVHRLNFAVKSTKYGKNLWSVYNVLDPSGGFNANA